MTAGLPISTVREQLSRSEPLDWRTFTVSEHVRFGADPDSTHHALTGDALTGVHVTLDTGRYQLTRDTLEETCAITGLKRAYARECPPGLLVPHLNYWYRGGLLTQPRKPKDFQFFTNGQTAVTFTKQGRQPLSNLMLLDTVLAEIRDQFGAVLIYADSRLSHDLRRTIVRLIIDVPGEWQPGIQLRNSITGLAQTYLDGYLHQPATGLGLLDTNLSKGPLSRRANTTDGDLTTWIRSAVSDILSGLQHTPKTIAATNDIRIDDNLTQTLKDVFDHYRIAVQHRAGIIDTLIDNPGPATIHTLITAITRAAAEPGLTPADTESLMRIAGNLPYNTDLCNGCHRFTHQH